MGTRLLLHLRRPRRAESRPVYRDVIASRSFAGYSQAMKSKGSRWTKENLAALIVDPQAFAPGTTMPSQGIDPALSRLIVEYLKYLDTQY